MLFRVVPRAANRALPIWNTILIYSADKAYRYLN
jgi:hypothetical protein